MEARQFSSANLRVLNIVKIVHIKSDVKLTRLILSLWIYRSFSALWCQEFTRELSPVFFFDCDYN